MPRGGARDVDLPHTAYGRQCTCVAWRNEYNPPNVGVARPAMSALVGRGVILARRRMPTGPAGSAGGFRDRQVGPSKRGIGTGPF